MFEERYVVVIYNGDIRHSIFVDVRPKSATLPEVICDWRDRFERSLKFHPSRRIYMRVIKANIEVLDECGFLEDSPNWRIRGQRTSYPKWARNKKTLWKIGDKEALSSIRHKMAMRDELKKRMAKEEDDC